MITTQRPVVDTTNIRQELVQTEMGMGTEMEMVMEMGRGMGIEAQTEMVMEMEIEMEIEMGMEMGIEMGIEMGMGMEMGMVTVLEVSDGQIDDSGKIYIHTSAFFNQYNDTSISVLPSRHPSSLLNAL